MEWIFFDGFVLVGIFVKGVCGFVGEVLVIVLFLILVSGFMEGGMLNCFFEILCWMECDEGMV